MDKLKYNEKEVERMEELLAIVLKVEPDRVRDLVGLDVYWSKAVPEEGFGYGPVDFKRLFQMGLLYMAEQSGLDLDKNEIEVLGDLYTKTPAKRVNEFLGYLKGQIKYRPPEPSERLKQLPIKDEDTTKNVIEKDKEVIKSKTVPPKSDEEKTK